MGHKFNYGYTLFKRMRNISTVQYLQSPLLWFSSNYCTKCRSCCRLSVLGVKARNEDLFQMGLYIALLSLIITSIGISCIIFFNGRNSTTIKGSNCRYSDDLKGIYNQRSIVDFSRLHSTSGIDYSILCANLQQSNEGHRSTLK